MSSKQQKYTVPSLERALNVLDVLAIHNEPIRFEDILKKTDIPRSTAFRVLMTLEEKGYIEKIEQNQNQKWRLGKRILKIGIDYVTNLDLRLEARHTMQWLADTTDELVQLGILFKGHVMYIDQIKRVKPITMYSEPGTLLPINISASGMVLASNLSEQQLQQIMKDYNFNKNTKNTISDKEEYIQLLKQVRKQNYAVDDEMYASGIRCVAAPIFNYAGDNIAAIGISGHTSTITDEKLNFFIENVKEAAKRISQRLGAK